MSATRVVRSFPVVLSVLVLLGAGSAQVQGADMTFSAAAEYNHILLNGTTPFTATVGNAATATDLLDWSVDNHGTSGLTLSGLGTGLAAGNTLPVPGSYTGSAYGNFNVVAGAVGTNNPGGGLAMNSPATASVTINVGEADAASGGASNLFGFNASEALYSLVEPGGSIAGLASKVVFGPTNKLGTVGTFLYGYNNTATPQVVSMNWRSRSLVETWGGGTVPGSPGSPIRSDEYGVWSDATTISLPVDTVFVLQLTYDEASLYFDPGRDEKWYADGGYIYLAWLDPSDSMLKNAVLGNTGASENVFMGDGPWNGADPAYTTLGHYGVDTSTNTVWAVLNHTSVFEATPEPATLSILALGALGLLRKRNRARNC